MFKIKCYKMCYPCVFCCHNLKASPFSSRVACPDEWRWRYVSRILSLRITYNPYFPCTILSITLMKNTFSLLRHYYYNDATENIQQIVKYTAGCTSNWTKYKHMIFYTSYKSDDIEICTRWLNDAGARVGGIVLFIQQRKTPLDPVEESISE